MPSQKPRVALTLTPELYAAIKDLGDALGKPVATVLVDFLVELIPELHGIAKMARMAQSGNKAATRRALAHMVGDQYAQVMTMQQPELFGKKRK